MNVLIRPCLISELETLQKIGYETFDDTFRVWNKPENIDHYLAEAFNSDKLFTELSNPDSHFFFLFVEDDLAGYIKVNVAPAQSDLNDPESLEIERIYVRKSYKGKGLGTRLMDYALRFAVEMGKRYAWLGVWDQNSDAIAFYQKMGFSEVGRHPFLLGDDLQTDLIMKKELDPNLSEQ